MSVERDPTVVLHEHHGLLALRCTEALYEAQPDLWRMGERGRTSTYDDFGHHLAALRGLDPAQVGRHVAYCYDLFERRGFPARWLDDAWATMHEVLPRELPADVARRALEVLDAGIAAGRPPAAG